MGAENAKLPVLLAQLHLNKNPSFSNRTFLLTFDTPSPYTYYSVVIYLRFTEQNNDGE